MRRRSCGIGLLSLWGASGSLSMGVGAAFLPGSFANRKVDAERSKRRLDIVREEFDDPETELDESEVRALVVENSIEQPVSDALPGGST